jgi:hypothetical protein
MPPPPPAPRIAPPPPPPPPPAIAPAPIGIAPQGAGGPSQQSNDPRASAFPVRSNAQALPNVGVTATVGGTVKQLRTDVRGVTSVGVLGPGTHDLIIPASDLQPKGGTAGPGSGVLVSIIQPGGQGSTQQLVEFVYRPTAVTQGVRVKISVPPEGRGGVVDWGGGARQVDTVRDGTRITVSDGGGRGRGGGGTDTIVRVGRMIMNQGNPCPQPDPWMCMGGPPPPPPEDPPQVGPPPEDPWGPPPIDDLPIPEINIIVDGGTDGITETQTDNKGTFAFPPPIQRPQTIAVALPRPGTINTTPPKPPVKVALVLPAGLSPQGAAALKLLEHIYAPNTQAQSLKVTITPIKDRSGKVTDMVVDWGDGTPKVTLSRDGKPVRNDAVNPQAIGRVIFTGATRK